MLLMLLSFWKYDFVPPHRWVHHRFLPSAQTVFFICIFNCLRAFVFVYLHLSLSFWKYDGARRSNVCITAFCPWRRLCLSFACLLPFSLLHKGLSLSFLFSQVKRVAVFGRRFIFAATNSHTFWGWTNVYYVYYYILYSTVKVIWRALVRLTDIAKNIL